MPAAPSASAGAAPSRRARVLVVDDHPVFRRGLVAMLVDEPWVAEVLEAGGVEEAVRTAVTGAVDLVAMDLRLPDGDGLDATGRILRARRNVRVLVLTMTEDQRTVAAALRVGASGYVLKRSDPEDVVTALSTVWRGGVVLGPLVGPEVLQALRDSPIRPAPFDRLTERELEIVRLLADGLANTAIARRLGVTEKTVRNQLTPIFLKLGVADRVQAALLAREAGLTPPRR